MTTDEFDKYHNLVEALSSYDDNSRIERAKRIDWASSLYQPSGLVCGELVPLDLMEEARECFVQGQYMAVVLCAASVVEHLLVAELEERNGTSNGKRTLGLSIEEAESAQMYSAETISYLKELNELRNPLAHRRGADDVSTLANRYLMQQVHPTVLKEKDAKWSLEVMYKFFLKVLKNK